MLSNFLNVGQKKLSFVKQPDYKILSLSGGGTLGIYTAKILEKIEEETGQPIGESFNLITGTSIGGIIALALARSVPAKEIVQSFYDCVPKIFVPREDSKNFRINKFLNLTSGTTKAKYSSEQLKSSIENIVGKDSKLKDVTYPVMVTSYDITAGRLRYFCAPFANPDGYNDLESYLTDIALASSAVPVIFPIHEFDNKKYVDGGVYANAPDLAALQTVVFNLGVPMEQIKMCSIGTMTGRFFLDDKIKNDSGIMSWGKEKRLPTLMVSAQSQFIIEFMKNILNDNYLRIDTIPSDPDIEIFSRDKENLDNICNYAENSWNSIDKKQIYKYLR